MLSFFQVCVFFESLISLRWGGGWGGGGGVGGVGGVLGGLITFLFINVPASAFLTRFSLLQVTV